MYDAVWLYALALEKLVQEDETFLQNLHSNRSSDALVKIIKEIDFNGVSGRINFPGRSSRLSDIDIIQWCREGDTLSGDTIGVYKPDYTRYMLHCSATLARFKREYEGLTKNAPPLKLFQYIYNLAP